MGPQHDRVRHLHCRDKEIDHSASSCAKGSGAVEYLLILELSQQNGSYRKDAVGAIRQPGPVNLLDRLEMKDEISVNEDGARGHVESVN